ncbi:MAG: phosphotransferase [Actinobacteria bacterium]|nr:phosphotransferase [Actinomycetota bacterium]
MMDETAIGNICSVLECDPSDISGVEQNTIAHTNTIFSFYCKGKHYIYRHPGEGTSDIIDRDREIYVQSLVDQAGIDGTTIFFDPDTGWKISRFIENTRALDYRNPWDVLRALDLLRRLHDAKLPCDWEFDALSTAAALERLLPSTFEPRLDFLRFKDDICCIYYLLEADDHQKMLCHNDASDNNFLITDDEMYLIDWEYAALCDPCSDLASFICGRAHSYGETLSILSQYYGEEGLTQEVLCHALGYIALTAYHWLVWGMYQESQGAVARELIDIWYDYVNDYSKIALRMYLCTEE